MRALRKRVEWVLTGRARNGLCPKCDAPTATLYAGRWECESCGAGRSLPEAPGWL